HLMPIIVAIDAIKPVLALGRANECRPALEIAKSRPDDLGPCPWVHLRRFINNHPIVVAAAHSVVIVSPIEPNSCASRILNPEFAFANGQPSNGRRVVF